MDGNWSKYKAEGDDGQNQKPSDDETVIVRFFNIESQAHIASALLNNQGIPNFLSSQLMNQLLPFGEGAIALHVRSTDALRARQILDSLDEDPDSDDENLEIDLDSGVVKVKPRSRDYRIPPLWYLLFIILCILIMLWHAFVYSENGFKIW